MTPMTFQRITSLRFLEVTADNPLIPLETARGIREKANREVILPSKKADVEIKTLGFHKVFDHLVLIERASSDWVIMPVNRDPLYQNRFPVPRVILERLTQVSEAGIDFDCLYTAHEIPPGLLENGSETDLRSVLTPPSLGEAEALSEALGESSRSWLFRASLIAGGIFAGGLLLSGAVLAQRGRRESPKANRREQRRLSSSSPHPLLSVSPQEPKAVQPDLRGYDPMLFGVITESDAPQSGDWGCFFLLAAWRW